MASVASMVRHAAAGSAVGVAGAAVMSALGPRAAAVAGGAAAGGGMFGGTNAYIIAAVIIVVLFLILRRGGAGEGEAPRPKKSEGAERERFAAPRPKKSEGAERGRFAAPPAEPREEPEANPLGAKNTLSVQTAEDAQSQWQDLLSQESSAPHPLLGSTTSDGPGRLPQLNGGRIASDMGLPGQAF